MVEFLIVYVFIVRGGGRGDSCLVWTCFVGISFLVFDVFCLSYK